MSGPAGLDISALRLHELMEREWLAVNHLGGYASQSVVGLNTRKYHGLLVAAMSPPARRMVILSRVEDFVQACGRVQPLSCCEYPGVVHPDGHKALRAFMPTPYPRWAYQAEGWTIEKSLRLIPGENTAVLTYTLLAGTVPVELEVKPLLALRGIHELMYQWAGRLEADVRSKDKRYLRIPPTARTPEVFFAHDGAFTPQPNWYLATIYRKETERGYAGLEDVWMPGSVRWTLQPGKSVHLVCSTEPINLQQTIDKAWQQLEIASPRWSLPHDDDSDSPLPALMAAADQFLALTAERRPAVVTSFPWSSPGVRDALISFAGLYLVTRRFAEGRALLEAIIPQISRGLVPSALPEDGSPAHYSAADASLWFINSVGQYFRYTHDEHALQQTLFEPLVEILRAYQGGTSLGIGLDGDGLVTTRAAGMPTTWMDAKTGDWVITPRAGRPVELTALWYNALRTVADLAEYFHRHDLANEFTLEAMRCRDSFNRRFWNLDGRCCFDVLTDGIGDVSIRPNQLLAISLPHAVLANDRQATVLEKVRTQLLTPMGVRTLSPDDPAYRGRYGGDVVARDRAYHQGSAYPWLLGPYVSAMVRIYGRTPAVRSRARHILAGCLNYLHTDGLGQLPELFDGDAPQRPGGAVASARSIAEILRCYAEDLLEPLPAPLPSTSDAAQFSK